MSFIDRNSINYKTLNDYNSLRNQYDPSIIINKYSNIRLEVQPNELQKYYEYLTKGQVILDELNYINERLKTEDLIKMRDNFLYLENIKQERERNMSSNPKEILKKDLGFEDLTPTVETGFELERMTDEDVSNYYDNEVKKYLEEGSKRYKASGIINKAIKGKIARNKFNKEQNLANINTELDMLKYYDENKYYEFLDRNNAYINLVNKSISRGTRKNYLEGKQATIDLQKVIRRKQAQDEYSKINNEFKDKNEKILNQQKEAINKLENIFMRANTQKDYSKIISNEKEYEDFIDAVSKNKPLKKNKYYKSFVQQTGIKLTKERKPRSDLGFKRGPRVKK